MILEKAKQQSLPGVRYVLPLYLDPCVQEGTRLLHPHPCLASSLLCTSQVPVMAI